MSMRARLAAAATLLLLTAAISPVAFGGGTVPVNGTANSLNTKDGGLPSDFTEPMGATFQAANPSTAVFDRLVQANQTYASSNKGVTNVVASTAPVTMTDPMTGATITVKDHSESHLQIVPGTGTLIGASKFFSNSDYYFFKLGSYFSKDGGKSFTSQIIPGYDRFTNVTDPVLAVDDRGDVYSLNLPFSLAYNAAGGVVWNGGPDNSAITINKSTDGGATWQAPVTIKSYDGSGLGFTPDKQWIVTDTGAGSPGQGNVYAFWTEFTGYSSHIVVSRSYDHGATWTDTVTVTPSSDQPFVQYAQPGVGPDGTIYLVYGRFPYAANVSNSSLMLQKSTDGGATWSAPSHIVDTVAVPYRLPNTTFRDGILQSAIVAPDGTIAIAYEDYATGDVDILFTRSTDGGQTWSAPVRVNDDPVRDGMDQFQPNIAAAPNGTLAIAYYDRRLACPTGDPNISAGFQGKYNTCIDTSITFSRDGGATWSPSRRITLNSWDPSLSAPRPYNGSTTFLGDYFGIALTNDTAWVLNVSTYNVGGQNPGNHQAQIAISLPVPKR